MASAEFLIGDRTTRAGEMMVGLRVLVVEDEALLGVLFGEVLEGMGHEVCAIAATEPDAIKAALRHHPDLLLVDVQLGVGNGVSAVTEILRSGFVPHVYYSGDISGIQASQPNAVTIQKPFRVSDLAKAIDRALGADQWPSDEVTHRGRA